jgi:hypothetical protein
VVAAAVMVVGVACERERERDIEIATKNLFNSLLGCSEYMVKTLPFVCTVVKGRLSTHCNLHSLILAWHTKDVDNRLLVL